MTPNEYQKLADRTVCNQLDAAKRFSKLSARDTQLLHAVIGIAGEAGELSSLVEKTMYYGRDIDDTEYKDEIGDILWYVAEACNALGYSMEEVMQANIEKLKVRYPEKYTDELSENRDREAEMEAIKNSTIS